MLRLLREPGLGKRVVEILSGERLEVPYPRAVEAVFHTPAVMGDRLAEGSADDRPVAFFIGIYLVSVTAGSAMAAGKLTVGAQRGSFRCAPQLRHSGL